MLEIIVLLPHAACHGKFMFYRGSGKALMALSTTNGKPPRLVVGYHHCKTSWTATNQGAVTLICKELLTGPGSSVYDRLRQACDTFMAAGT